MSSTIRLAIALLPLVTLACSEEIPTPGSTITTFEPPTEGTTTNAAATLPKAPPLPVDAGAPPPAKKDAGKITLPLGCATLDEQEPNDVGGQQALGEGRCGTLVANDVDTFTGQSGDGRTIRFSATGDAVIVVGRFGVDQTAENGEEIDIPSIGPSVAFSVSVRSPSGAPQAYRIDFGD